MENQRRIRMELGRQRTLAAARDLQRAARSLLTRMYIHPSPHQTPYTLQVWVVGFKVSMWGVGCRSLLTRMSVPYTLNSDP